MNLTAVSVIGHDGGMGTTRPRALVTAPFRGPGLDTLNGLAEVVLDPWIDHRPLRLYDEAALAARIEQEGATVVVCEADRCAGPVFDLPLLAVGSTRGDPTNVDLAGATARGIPVLHAPGRNADGVAEMTVALLFAVTRHVLAADTEVRAGEVFRDGPSPTSASGPASWRAAPPAWSGSVRWGGRRSGGSRGWG